LKTVAIIPAGGSGTRMKSGVSKQYLLLGGIPILVHTLRVFQETPAVDDIFLVLPAHEIESARQKIVEKYNLTKVNRILTGGKHRQDSVKSGIDALGAEYDVVMIHDGVRPFVSRELVDMAIREAAEAAAVTVGVPVRDTVKTVGAGGFVGKTIKRDRLWLTQTPQAFSAPVIKEAYRRAYKDDYYGTDDAVLVERMGIKVKMLPGSYDNIKITTEIDIEWGELFLKMRGKRDECNKRRKTLNMAGSGK
jgi:2-C-methyl-D-erythritol 4-phosphate cytidylyltransferase